jgi:hypothetical protein
MIYIVDDSNCAAYEEQIETLLAHTGDSMRSRAGAELRATTYLLGLDRHGELICGVRAERWRGPGNWQGNVVSLEQARSVYRACEFNGWFVSTTIGKQQMLDEEEARLLVAVLEYGLSLGLASASLRCTPSFSKMIARLGLCAGKSRARAGARNARHSNPDLYLEVSHSVADSLRELCSVCGPVLRYEAVPPPYAANENASLCVG